MQETTFTKKNLTPSAKWIFTGNLITAVGFLAVSIGQILKLAEAGVVEPYYPITKTGVAEKSGLVSAKDYFS